MKKFFALILTLILSCSIALADCSCVVNPTIRMIAFQMGATDIDMEVEELEALATLAAGVETECTCSETKLSILRVLIRNMTVLELNLGEVKWNMMLEYIAHCGCCGMESDSTSTSVEPSSPTHTHHGGTHENGGKCTGCGVTYQKHEIVWKYTNNSIHTEHCSCGWIGKTENHKSETVITIERDENGNSVGKYCCTVCGAYFYKYVSVKESGCSCECCYGNCCENCSCGCACK